MPEAYILITTEIGSENQVRKALRRIDGVEEVHSLWGVYDIIVNVRANSMDELKSIITSKIEKVDHINSKLTMIVTGKPSVLQEQVIFETPLIQ